MFMRTCSHFKRLSWPCWMKFFKFQQNVSAKLTGIRWQQRFIWLCCISAEIPQKICHWIRESVMPGDGLRDLATRASFQSIVCVERAKRCLTSAVNLKIYGSTGGAVFLRGLPTYLITCFLVLQKTKTLANICMFLLNCSGFLAEYTEFLQ